MRWYSATREAAQDADALLLAVHWSRIDDVLKQAGDLSGKVIVTCTLPMDAGDTKLITANSPSGAEELAKKAARAKVVCAFNTVPSEVLFGVYAAKHKNNRPSLVYCGDDQNAKDVAAERCGLRCHGRRPSTDCAVHRAIRTAPRPTRLRGRRRTGTGVSFRAVRGVDCRSARIRKEL
jgi:hypothetical protein